MDSWCRVHCQGKHERERQQSLARQRVPVRKPERQGFDVPRVGDQLRRALRLVLLHPQLAAAAAALATAAGHLRGEHMPL